MDKIICVGKNYLKHAVELGDAVPEEPLYFLKPPSVLVESPASLQLPAAHGEIHHELELVLRIGRGGFSHYTFGLDLTARELQNKLKKAGQPWEKAKVFAASAIVGAWQPVRSLSEVLEIPFSLRINGETRQQGVGRDMRWSPDFVLGDLARWWPVHEGDLLFTGTPEGVGPLRAGDAVEVLGGPVSYSFRVNA